MGKHWAQIFLDLAKSNGIDCSPKKYSRGWLETAIINKKICFTKSVTYNKSRKLYFIGIDTSKVNDNGDLVLFCGGFKDEIKDLFIIPWNLFFSKLRKTEPINSRNYEQYKFRVSDRDNK